mmetsp:Transcript_70655/g.220527  ORF Transcript_70655/g.220527 Transcript_70655/m.220527 type:complete len:303 (+) Transcript_70655:283-1191(+)
MANHGLGAVHHQAVRLAVEGTLDRSHLSHVTRRRGGAVAVHVADVLCRDTCILHGGLDTPSHTVALGVGLCHVVRVAGVGPAEVLRVDGCAPPLRVLQALQAEDARALAHDEAVAGLVPGPGRPLRLVVPRGEGLASVEAGNARQGDGCLGAARQDDVALPALDVAGSRGDAVVPRGAGCDHSVVRPLETHVDSQQAAGHVDQGVGHKEGGEALALEELLHVLDRGLQGRPAHGRADQDAAPFLCQLLECLRAGRQTGILQSLLAGDDGVFDHVIHPTLALLVDKPGCLEALNLRCNLCREG